ncbi:hypothetical protein MES4922_30449 [Mesorhizobium ventifaucium]|uniref:Uncharacterized protein n=1 Tax=Mesorhizobium ventifaucium TaxID=666020 RepID=A0ABM9E0H1_9HYPH|nr:hypothetical protein MES4922_30449 [Mesorhizobium ventifaucium]
MPFMGPERGLAFETEWAILFHPTPNWAPGAVYFLGGAEHHGAPGAVAASALLDLVADFSAMCRWNTIGIAAISRDMPQAT